MTKITSEHMKSYVEANPHLVKLKPTSKDGVFVLKYNQKVFYKNLWTPELQECRGTVVDADYNIISRPFTKIFNRGERNTDIPRDTNVYACEKINGFMACGTWHNGELLVSTTGTIDSPFADIARKHLQKYERMFSVSPKVSFIFEICDPEDNHVIPENAGAYLLGARYKLWNSLNHSIGETELDMIADINNIPRPKWSYGIFSDYVNNVKTVEHEGYVCYTQDGEYELKMKSPFYLTTKFLGRIRDDRMMRLMKTPENLKQIIDEEFYDIIDYISAISMEDFLSWREHVRMEFVRNYFINRNKL